MEQLKFPFEPPPRKGFRAVGCDCNQQIVWDKDESAESVTPAFKDKRQKYWWEDDDDD